MTSPQPPTWRPPVPPPTEPPPSERPDGGRHRSIPVAAIATTPAPRRRRIGSARLAILGVPVGVLASGVLVWHSTYAAFQSTTTNGAQTFATGTVTLADDDSGSLLFTGIGTLKPNDTGTACIRVTYSGSITGAKIRMYATVNDSGLGSDLNFRIERGTGATTPGSFSSNSCAGYGVYTPEAYPLAGNGTWAALSTLPATYGAASGNEWTANPGDSKVYRFTYQIPSSATNAGKSTQVTFTWEADSP